MSAVKAGIRWPFRILGMFFSVCALFAWGHVVLDIILEVPTRLSLFLQSVILIEVPLLLFYLGIPAVYGYYPSAVARWVPLGTLKFVNRTMSDLFWWLRLLYIRWR